MFDATKNKTELISLTHAKKLKKVQETLQLLSKKSSFFADLRKYYKGQEDIQENTLDSIYAAVINLVYNGKK